MSRPKILDDLDKKIEVSEEVEIDQTLPVDADTLGGNPPSYYASTAYVSQVISEYLRTILGRSY